MILHYQFIETAKKNKSRTAIKDRMTGATITFEKALIASLILSKKFSIYKDKYLGIMIPTSAGAMLSSIGTLMAGKIPVMINYSTGAEENCRYAQRKCGFTTIITSRALLEKIKCPLIDGMICIEDIMTGVTVVDKVAAAIRTKLPARSIINSLPATVEDDTAAILFTSGSEKDPKAVQLSHKNIGSNAIDSYSVLELTPDDVMLSGLPLFHIFGLQTNFWLPLTHGFTAVTYANPLEYKTVVSIMKREGCTAIASTPIFLSGYLRESKPGDFEKLTLIVAGADKTPDWLREGYREKHNIEIVEGYGATETSPVISVNRRNWNKPGSVGLPYPSCHVKIIDIATGEELPIGQEGKIMVSGDLVMKGYLDESQTREAITDGWYFTGDIGLLDEDGFLWHKGRLKRFVKIGGEMVSLVKTEMIIEEVLHEDIECCVVDVPDKVKGASLVCVLTHEIDKDKLIKDLADKLPPIAIPKKFLVIDEFPKMGSGKADFRTIGEMAKEKLA
ncbi:AMP-binding protein [Spirochaeta isovalerica]|uniref:Acyl-[acyl-carrier-protein]-phospholipid O-acyltransferase/long-chain-fatty-acid--[acyl-carrier-protein] ligase n=1 Tax=Spirochaeta isovalerica TaxID=150 RepID=A0A841R6N3_9SPIO|nr:acyl-[acyl-carrier-protein]-phospholipid O-acyltransferase/long-chain-fatty-acid--[acyl-carrier-protein] ligase [Spirochaeta isovalerica]